MRQCSCLNLPAADGAAFRSTELDGEFIHIVDARSELDNHTKRQYSDRLERHVKRRLSALEEQAAHALRRARRLPVCTENLDPGIVMMKSAEYRVRTDDSSALNRARDQRIFIQ